MYPLYFNLTTQEEFLNQKATLENFIESIKIIKLKTSNKTLEKNS